MKITLNGDSVEERLKLDKFNFGDLRCLQIHGKISKSVKIRKRGRLNNAPGTAPQSVRVGLPPSGIVRILHLSEAKNYSWATTCAGANRQPTISQSINHSINQIATLFCNPEQGDYNPFLSNTTSAQTPFSA